MSSVQSKIMRKQISKKTSSTNFSVFDKEVQLHHVGFSSIVLKKKKSEKDSKPEYKQHLFRGVRSSLASPKNSVKKSKNKQNHYRTVFNTQKITPTSTPMQLQPRKIKGREDYRFIYQIGSGGFGRVWKVQNKRDNATLAMKQISKAKVIMKKSLNSVINEKQILERVQNPFIINMKHAFQDRNYLYLTMEYLRGGDLRYHLCYYEFFNEEQTKFIVACIVLGLQYIHSKGIIHRDLKPENLVFEENGYLRITDFGVARKKRSNNSQETSGTPGYMAPQVICRANHSYESDFFALGVIVYQMMMGIRPYMGQSRKQIRDKILAHQARLTQRDLPVGWDYSVMDFVNKLIKRNKQSRLGYNGIEQIKGHPWLKSINWNKMNAKSIRPPFVPGNIAESPEYQRQMENTEVSQANQETLMLLRTDQIQTLFKAYDESAATTQKSSKKLMWKA